MGRIVVLFAAVAAALALSAWGQRLPDPRSADAPAGLFSAERAMADVRAISATPRPTGTPAAAAARAHLADRLRALGTEVSLQRTTAVHSRGLGEGGRAAIVGAELENLVAVVPGRDRRLPALLVMTHSDSVPGSPGAADDAIGVAASVEATRALLNRGPPARDVILLITDAEELGLLGARAFFAEHPLRDRVGLVLNLEARGSSGPAVMFETGARNGALIESWAQAVARPNGNSLTGFVYGLLPNDTDFSVPRDRDLPGLNIAIVANQQDYHTPSATAANLDRRSLQHMGDQTLSLMRALSGPAQPLRAANAVYFSVFDRAVVRYPAWAGWLPLAAAGALWAYGVARVRRNGAAGVAEIARGAGGLLLIGALAALVLSVVPRMFDEVREVLVQFGAFEAGVALLTVGLVLSNSTTLLRGGRFVWVGLLFAGAAMAVGSGFRTDVLGLGAAAVVLALLVVRRRKAEPLALYAGATLGLLAIAVAAQAFAPEAAFPFGWAALISAGGLAVVASGRTPFSGAPAAIAAGLGLLAFAWLATLAHMVLVTLGAETPQALAAIVVLAVPLLFPLLAPAAAKRAARPVATLLLLVGLGLLAVIAFREPWSPRSPRPTIVAYLAEPDARRFLRYSGLERLDPWSRRVLETGGGTPRRAPLPEAFAAQAWSAPAPPVAATPVRPTLSRAADGRLTLLIPPRAGRELRLSLRSTAPITDLRVAGRSGVAAVPRGREVRLRWTGRSALPVSFAAATPGELAVTASVLEERWPAEAQPLPPRAAHEAAFGTSDSTLVVSRLRARF